MSVDITTLSLLTDIVTRAVFEQVVKNRSIQLRELIKKLDPVLERDVALTTLKKLKDACLIAEKSSSLTDWNPYYVTADGLEASRKIRHLMD